jgi:hypothetical protein
MGARNYGTDWPAWYAEEPPVDDAADEPAQDSATAPKDADAAKEILLRIS